MNGLPSCTRWRHHTRLLLQWQVLTVFVAVAAVTAAPAHSQEPPLQPPLEVPQERSLDGAASEGETPEQAAPEEAAPQTQVETEPLLPPLETPAEVVEASGTGNVTPPATEDEPADTAAADDSPSTNRKAPIPAGQLPWSTKDRQAAPPTSPKEMLELFDIGESQLRALFDGEPLGAADEETLVNFLFRFPRMGEENIFRWRTPITMEELAENPAEHRAAVVRVAGVVRKIERRELIPEIAALYDFDDYWVLTMDPQDSDHEVIVCTRVIPPQWGDEPIAEANFEAELNGFFLKTGSPQPAAQLIFAASRVEWHPKSVDPQRNIVSSHVLLADHGFDVGRLAALQDLNGKPLGAKDRAAIYEMLAAIRTMEPAEVKEAGAKKVDLRSLLIEPETIHGHLVRLKIRAAKITRLQLDEPDIRDLYGIDHYYQIDAYLPLGDQSVRLGNDPEAPEYRNAFPITLCMVDLPESLKDVDKRMASGESPSEVFDREIQTDAFFYRIWSYRSQFIDERTPGKLQPAPMMLATQLQLVDPGGVNSDTLSMIFGIGFVSLLAIVCLSLWWTGRGDAAVEKELQDKRFPLQSSLDELDV